MQYRHFGKLNQKPSLLGFGVMRLPVINDNYGDINIPEATKMIRFAIDNGVNYIDTAWGYHEGKSEIITGMALKDGYREKVMLATKNPSWHIKKPEDWDYYLNEQLKRLQTDSIDFYLQHSLNAGFWEDFKKFNLWDRAMKAKAEGKIKHFGFSFHDSFDVFSDILDTYEWDFCQIQFNYLDTDYQAGVKGLEKAAAKNTGVVIMEPLRGGRLITGLPKDLLDEMESYPIKRKPVEWALRWIANHPAVSVILSGMSTMEQVEENLRICSSPDIVQNSMSSDELAFIDNLAGEWKAKKLIGCTGCNYCMPCPNGVDIPGCFSNYNYSHSAMANGSDIARNEYKKKIENKSDATQCVECGLCESACPQHLPIIETLKSLNEELTD